MQTQPKHTPRTLANWSELTHGYSAILQDCNLDVWKVGGRGWQYTVQNRADDVFLDSGHGFISHREAMYAAERAALRAARGRKARP